LGYLPLGVESNPQETKIGPGSSFESRQGVKTLGQAQSRRRK
jgi:hypothetical protein